MIRKHFRFKRVVLGGLAFAAFAAPVAEARHIDAGGSPVTPVVTQITSEHSFQTPTLTQLQPSVVTSERSYGAPGPDPSYAPLVVSSTSSDKFNWQDAGIGASVAFGITLLLLTAVALGRRSRSGLDRPGLTSA
jgi:hypothetical protein